MRTISGLAVLALTTASSAFAQDNPGQDSGLSENETSYWGAWILEGGEDLTIGAHGNGPILDDEEQTTYAFMTGNTLYLGAEDSNGNGVDAIVEFFWFESSIDRGSDFYVAVIKAKSTPNRSEDYTLEVGDEPVLVVEANADTTNGSFRWDWSSPFESYGMDSYGEVTLETEYGIGVNAEGTATYATKVEESGAQAEVDVQAKGFLDSDFRVATQYQVTLWRWEVNVDGAPHNVRWDMTLHNSDREDQNAYHEFFLVIQADEGEAAVIEDLTIGGHFDGWWWGDHDGVSVTLDDIVLTRPKGEFGVEDGDPTVDDPTDDRDPGRPGNLEDGDETPGTCSNVAGGTFGLSWLALAGLALVRRRR